MREAGSFASDSHVPTRFVRSLLSYLDSQGCDLPAIIEAVELPFDPLDPINEDKTEIPAMCYSRLYQWAMWIVQDESFGLHAQGVRPLGTFRMMSYTLINCRNLEHAINRAADFNEILKTTRNPQQVSLRRHSRHPQGWPLRISPGKSNLQAVYFYDTDVRSAEQMGELALLGIASGMSIWHRFCSWLIDTPIELDEV
ncbi:MAG: AraC family transcriptional regulator ligand-binding domain-containing protein, partial [Pseudomonadales bacterium]|nr:AraC family transcriptional regulator ligand-binding domain-containing protein [Pseudomonadales bacterium]